MTTTPTLDPHRLLIVGAGPGLSASIARRFGKEGFSVTLVARREQALEELAGQLRDTDISVDTFTADAADPHTFRAALDDLAQRIAPAVVVYNAALITSDNVLSSDTDYLLSAYAVDALSAINAAQVFTPAMRDAREGTFLATGGYAGIDPQPPYATISLGKAGLRTAVSLMHDELKADGVHATSITIGGAIARGTAVDPDRIADTYWDLHTQPAADWQAEIAFPNQQENQ
jgi:short-subunit dehydrogenase